MKRRSFFQHASVAIAGGAAAAGRPRQGEADARHGAADAAQVLITSAQSALSRAIATKLSDSWRVRVTAPVSTDTPFPFVQSDLGDDDTTTDLVDKVHAIVHVAVPPAAASGTELIDYRTRGTYNLLRAAARQGVRKLVYLSSLAIMRAYDERYGITEVFRPRPTPDPETLSHYLGEFTCREFARAGALDVVVLRCGAWEPTETGAAPAAALPLTGMQDVALAVALALGQPNDTGKPDRRLGPWSVVHLHSEPGSTRFPLDQADRLLRYRPETTGDAP